jgi:hypothetical protein
MEHSYEEDIIKNIIKYKSNSILVYSSMIFFINIIFSFIYKYYVGSVLFLFLLITSLFVHSNNNLYVNIIDKIAIILLIFYGFYVYIPKCIKIKEHKGDKLLHKIFISIMTLFTFILGCFIYIYGYLNNEYCWNKNKNIAGMYHSIMHMVNSIGHILLVIL